MSQITKVALTIALQVSSGAPSFSQEPTINQVVQAPLLNCQECGSYKGGPFQDGSTLSYITNQSIGCEHSWLPASIRAFGLDLKKISQFSKLRINTETAKEVIDSLMVKKSFIKFLSVGNFELRIYRGSKDSYLTEYISRHGSIHFLLAGPDLIPSRIEGVSSDPGNLLKRYNSSSFHFIGSESRSYIDK